MVIPGARLKNTVSAIVGRDDDHRDRGEKHADRPKIGPRPRRVGAARDRQELGPAGRCRAVGGEKAAVHDHSAGDQKPYRKQVEPGGDQVCRADLQRYQVGAQRDRKRRHYQVDHGRAMDGEKLVVCRRRDVLQAWAGKLERIVSASSPPRKKNTPGDHHDVHPDPLVVGRRDRVDQPAGASLCRGGAHAKPPAWSSHRR